VPYFPVSIKEAAKAWKVATLNVIVRRDIVGGTVNITRVSNKN